MSKKKNKSSLAGPSIIGSDLPKPKKEIPFVVPDLREEARGSSSSRITEHKRRSGVVHKVTQRAFADIDLPNIGKKARFDLDEAAFLRRKD